jgi:hypothetical protein
MVKPALTIEHEFDPEKSEEVRTMEPFRPSFRRRLASIADSLRKLRTTLTPHAQEVRIQRMCPFCGLITLRASRSCLECGKSLTAVSLERKESKQQG